jgi:hypothetical protein
MFTKELAALLRLLQRLAEASERQATALERLADGQAVQAIGQFYPRPPIDRTGVNPVLTEDRR